VGSDVVGRCAGEVFACVDGLEVRVRVVVELLDEDAVGAALRAQVYEPGELAQVRDHADHREHHARPGPPAAGVGQGLDSADRLLEASPDPDPLVGLLRRAVDRDGRAGQAGAGERVGPRVGHQRRVGRDPRLDTRRGK